VLELLKTHGGIIGGESSGHLLCLDKATTGDALVNALQIISIMRRAGRTLAELVEPMPKYPQVLLNVRVARHLDPESHPAVQSALIAARERLAASGRIVLRASGTEPVIRVMVEGRDGALVRSTAEALAQVVSTIAA
jgi:phosphoglucosamine mutase